jgi:adrenodoxin-NADP+ reductase
VNVHIFEKELVPSGLIRYGMAPDHERIKKVGNDLLNIVENDSCKFFGGVEIVNFINY